MIHIKRGFKKILKSGFYIVRIRIPDPESGKFETNFFLKCIVANLFPETNFSLRYVVPSIGSTYELDLIFREFGSWKYKIHN